MIKLHATRLMRSGEVVLWHNGKMVWTGAVGTHPTEVIFDAVSLHVDDGAVMAARVPAAATPEEYSLRWPDGGVSANGPSHR